MGLFKKAMANKKYALANLGSWNQQFSVGENEQTIWVFPKRKVPQNGWFVMDNPIKMDDLGKTHYFWKHPFETNNFHVFSNSQWLFGALVTDSESFGESPSHECHNNLQWNLVGPSFTTFEDRLETPFFSIPVRASDALAGQFSAWRILYENSRSFWLVIRNIELVGGWTNPLEKICSSKWEYFPK